MAPEFALLLSQKLRNLSFLLGIQVHKSAADAQRMVDLFQSGETPLQVCLEGAGSRY